MGFINKKLGLFIVFLIFLNIGFSQNDKVTYKDSKLLDFYISHPEMKSTSGVVIRFKDKEDFIFQILNTKKELLFTKQYLKETKVSFKINFSNFKKGEYEVIIRDLKNNLLYKSIIFKK